MATYEICYYARGEYCYKDVVADSVEKAIKKARVKNIITLRIVTASKALAYANPSSYTYREAKKK